jgi:hypothetical protein
VRLPQLYKDLQDEQSSGTDRLHHTAWEKRQVGEVDGIHCDRDPSMLKGHHVLHIASQEAYIYSKTGARFYDTPNCPDTPQRPKVYNVSGETGHYNLGGTI